MNGGTAVVLRRPSRPRGRPLQEARHELCSAIRNARFRRKSSCGTLCGDPAVPVRGWNDSVHGAGESVRRPGIRRIRR
ncbi:hypothetical protein ABT266_04940, partial [Amycolatopsis sp. NPDC000746]|uniref:hypothetical protein n=1 Tax=Amycolatopsis sp. NPDC000746 TaxID=3154270 RepID=UPI0033264A44